MSSLLNLLTFLDVTNASDLCDELGPLLRWVGFVKLGIQIGVPLILIFVGMFGLAKAVMEKEEKAVKAAQKALINKTISAVAVFLVATVVSLLMGLIGNDDYRNCLDCINSPFRCDSGTTDLE